MATKTTATDALTWTLGAGVADTFNFTDNEGGSNSRSGVPYVLIYNQDATNIVWVKPLNELPGGADTAATVAGAGCIPVPNAGGSATIAIKGRILSVISTGASVVTAVKKALP